LGSAPSGVPEAALPEALQPSAEYSAPLHEKRLRASLAGVGTKHLASRTRCRVAASIT